MKKVPNIELTTDEFIKLVKHLHAKGWSVFEIYKGLNKEYTFNSIKAIVASEVKHEQ